ncbi:hypothetical protein V5O48_007617 [Marasmius crinis-equi]|uniref:UBA domain-containing protein n=1 Tax=Marasmius crinis-equi TaxID=585013 RepID=A0ABR3FGW8_9AGAR
MTQTQNTSTPNASENTLTTIIVTVDRTPNSGRGRGFGGLRGRGFGIRGGRGRAPPFHLSPGRPEHHFTHGPPPVPFGAPFDDGRFDSPPARSETMSDDNENIQAGTVDRNLDSNPDPFEEHDRRFYGGRGRGFGGMRGRGFGGGRGRGRAHAHPFDVRGPPPPHFSPFACAPFDDEFMGEPEETPDISYDCGRGFGRMRGRGSSRGHGRGRAHFFHPSPFDFRGPPPSHFTQMPPPPPAPFEIDFPGAPGDFPSSMDERHGPHSGRGRGRGFGGPRGRAFGGRGCGRPHPYHLPPPFVRFPFEHHPHCGPPPFDNDNDFPFPPPWRRAEHWYRHQHRDCGRSRPSDEDASIAGIIATLNEMGFTDPELSSRIREMTVSSNQEEEAITTALVDELLSRPAPSGAAGEQQPPTGSSGAAGEEQPQAGSSGAGAL